jgi:ribonucleoside-diphosphate reductase alpha chain
MYSYEEALKTSMEYFQGSELSAKVFVDKYALRDKENNLLESNPDQMHRRLAKEFARIEATKFKNPYTEDFIYNLFKNYSVIIPQGSPIMGIGNPYSYVTLSNCYVLTTPEDSYNSILMTDRELVNISKRRGGVGINLSKLRPAGSSTNNAARTSTGIESWMERYSNSIREVAQNGRRGALMLTLSVHHPDIETFITIKNDKTKVTGANISVMLTDEFLNAVKKNEEFELRFPVDSSTPTVSKKVNAKKIWDLIIKNAHAMAEPGLLFWDNIIKESPADCYKEQGFETKATNPCSEIPLSELDSCRLMAINLFSCVINPFEKDAKYDYKLLYLYSQIAQRLMDDLIDLELECIDKILKKIKNDPESETIKREEYDLWYNIRQNCVIGRRTGLGPTVLGDTLAALGIKYGSNESIGIVEEIYKTLKFGAYQSSVDIAKELGPFICWDKDLEKDNLFLNRFKEETKLLTEQKSSRDYIDALNGHEIWSDMRKYGRRNIALLTTAPTGTISTQASIKVGDKLYFNTTAGIEPLFKTHYTRRKKGNPGDKNFKSDFVDQKGDHWQEFEVYHSGVQAWMDITGKDKIDKTCPYFNCTAEEINWVQRVKLQAAAQKHIDHAISSGN